MIQEEQIIQTELSTYLAPHSFRQWLKKWRGILSRVVTVLILAVFVYWGWQNYLTIQQVFISLGFARLVELVLLLTMAVILSTLSFTLLVRSMGYPFTYLDGYHSLNLSQIAAMVPGKIWGFAGLAGLLWSRGISKRDSLLIISLHTLLMLSAAVLVGAVGLIPTIGWGYTFLCLVPVLLLLVSHKWLDAMRLYFFTGSSPLPTPFSMLRILVTGTLSWVVVSACFAILVYHVEGKWPGSPLLVASAFPAGYVAGFVSLITPSGLGVREGVIALILGPLLGNEKALALAIVFRVVHTAVMWLNIAVTLGALSFGRRALHTKVD